MGFFKRLLSIGGKKNSKSKPSKSPLNISQPLPNAKRGSVYPTVAGAPYARSTQALQDQEIIEEEEDHEAAVHRLLRTSSARYAVVNEVDYTDLPPMPHPINAVLEAQNIAEVQKNSTGRSTLAPSPSTASLASTTLSTRGGTYNVTVYRKQRLSQGPEEVLATERKKRESAHLNANDSRMLKLRSVPSVVSLVSLYDDEGRLPEGVFSNDVSEELEKQPKKNYKEVPMASEDDDEKLITTGRPQVKRNGSTLRQLLGASTNGKPGDASEGDISWAERFLGELDNSSASTHSSFILPTPTSAYGPSYGGDISEIADTTVDNPAISSMNVELSIATDASEIFGEDFNFGEIKKAPSYESTLNEGGRTPTNKLSRSTNLSHKGSIGPGTPQRRASQVFGFIKKRASKFVEKDERDLPEPPSAFSSPSSNGHAGRTSQDTQSQNRRSRANSSEQDHRDEREVDNHLKSHFSEDSCGSTFTKESNNGAHLFATEPTPRSIRKRPTSERMEAAKEGGLDQMKGMMKRLSFNLGARESTSSAREEKHPEPVATFVLAPAHMVAETPIRPAAEVDAAKQERDVRVLMTGPTKVIVTAPTPGTVYHTQTGYSLNRVPRGPRGPNSKRRTSGSSRSAATGGSREEKSQRSTEERRRSRQERADRENVRKVKEEKKGKVKEERRGKEEKYRGLSTDVISTPRKKVPTRPSSGRSTSSVSSNGSNENLNYGVVYAEAKRFVDGENSGKMGSLGVKSDIPLTPLRTSRRVSINHEAFFKPPQPAAPAPAGRGVKLSSVMGLSPEEAKEKRREKEKGLYSLHSGRTGKTARSNRV